MLKWTVFIAVCLCAAAVRADSFGYRYDALDRLIEADDPTRLQRFDYDANGNRTAYEGDALWPDPLADYRVVVDPLLTRVEIGQTATVTITAENIGATAINEVTLSVSLTPILQLDSVVSNGWSCQHFGPLDLVCTRATLAAQQSDNITLQLVADTLCLTDVLVMLSAAESNSMPADAVRLALVEVLPASDLEDRDADALPDTWERLYGLDANYHGDAELDRDLDGLSNLLEWQLGTLPNAADSDGDQLPDAWEYAHGFDPLNNADAEQDADNDGLSNRQEYLLQTDPHNSDTDGDGLVDAEDSEPLFNPRWMQPALHLLFSGV